jgi:succinate dehydrogenase / fumarate reductase cytochrome b subunit
MRRVAAFHRTTVGMKVLMAASGVILVLYLLLHLFGNLKVYVGRLDHPGEKFNAYAEFLREFGSPLFGHEQFLWIFRAILLLAVVVHIWSAVSLTRRSWAARGSKYKKTPHEELEYASRTMRWGGALIFFFVIYHVAHFTTGQAHPDFQAGNAYHNFVTGFQVWPVSAVYVVFMLVLGFHLYHGVWSGLQTLGLDNPRYRRYRRGFALALALIVMLGNISFPVAVLTGFLSLN